MSNSARQDDGGSHSRTGKRSGGDATSRTAQAEKTGLPAGERIAKVVARAGVCSRRQAEVLIAEGRIKVNGTVLKTPAITVTDADTILVDNKPLPDRERTRLWLYHKKRGSVTTNRDPQGRRTIFDMLPGDIPRTMTVGRLDINTEGLLLLTNDGGLARILELPSTGWLRRYRVRVHGRVDPVAIEKLRSGITVDGMVYGAIEGTVDRTKGANTWLTLGLREGKNREVKKVLESLGLSVSRLIRISFGPFQLGELERGALKEVPARALREQLGTRLAAEAGVDLAPPPRQSARPTPRPVSKRPKSKRPEDKRTGGRTKPATTPSGRGQIGGRGQGQERPPQCESSAAGLRAADWSPPMIRRSGQPATGCGRPCSIFWLIALTCRAPERGCLTFLPGPARSALRRCRGGQWRRCLSRLLLLLAA